MNKKKLLYSPSIFVNYRIINVFNDHLSSDPCRCPVGLLHPGLSLSETTCWGRLTSGKHWQTKQAPGFDSASYSICQLNKLLFQLNIIILWRHLLANFLVRSSKSLFSVYVVQLYLAPSPQKDIYICIRIVVLFRYRQCYTLVLLSYWAKPQHCLPFHFVERPWRGSAVLHYPIKLCMWNPPNFQSSPHARRDNCFMKQASKHPHLGLVQKTKLQWLHLFLCAPKTNMNFQWLGKNSCIIALHCQDLADHPF